MTTLRETAQQILEALDAGVRISPKSILHDWLRAALTQKQDEPDACTWHQDGDSDSGVYDTSCGHYFRLEDGTPEDNKMVHCCYCGKKLVQELIAEDSDE